MIWMIGGAVVVGAVGLAAWFGCFRSVSITEERFRGGTFFYSDFQGSIRNIGVPFTKVCADRTKIFGQNTKGVCVSGVYYDSPNEIKNQEQLRASTGLIVNSELVNSAVEKSFSDLGYKKKALPGSLALYGKFPVKMQLSCMIGAWKFYPSLHKYLVQNKEKYSKVNLNDTGAVEMIEDGWMHYYFPIENGKEFVLSPYPKPELKEQFKKDL